jgi:hypothetical protein
VLKQISFIGNFKNQISQKKYFAISNDSGENPMSQLISILNKDGMLLSFLKGSNLK